MNARSSPVRDLDMLYLPLNQQHPCAMHDLWPYTRLHESMQPKPAATPPSSLWSPLVRSR